MRQSSICQIIKISRDQNMVLFYSLDHLSVRKPGSFKCVSCTTPPNVYEVENEPHARGRILVDFWLFGRTGRFCLNQRGHPCRANFLNIHRRKLVRIESYVERILGFIPGPTRLASRAHFPSVLTILKTALVSIIFILELSVLHKSCLELNFQAKRIPCLFSYVRALPVFNIEYSNFLNVHRRKKFL